MKRDLKKKSKKSRKDVKAIDKKRKRKVSRKGIERIKTKKLKIRTDRKKKKKAQV